MTIVDEREMRIRKTPTEETIYVAVTYDTVDLVRRTVYIPKADYSDKALKEAIKADLEALKPEKPRTLKL